MTISWPPIPLLWPSWSIVRLVFTMLGHLKGQCEKWFISKYYKYGTYLYCLRLCCYLPFLPIPIFK